MTIQLMPFYTRGEKVTDLAFYRIMTMAIYADMLGVMPILYVNGRLNPCIIKWWEASLN